MKTKMKMIVGMALVLGIASVALLAIPIHAYVNGAANGDFLRTQDQDRLRTRNCDCDGDMLQTREQIRDRLRTHDCGGNCTCDGTQLSRIRQRVQECAMNRVCNCSMGLEQYRYQYRG